MLTSRFVRAVAARGVAIVTLESWVSGAKSNWEGLGGGEGGAWTLLLAEASNSG
jgi:hypothetical protein